MKDKTGKLNFIPNVPFMQSAGNEPRVTLFDVGQSYTK